MLFLKSYIQNPIFILISLLTIVALINPASVFAQSVSDDVTVTATVDHEPPTVNITNPNDGDTVWGTVNVTADANDDGGVTKVEFYIDGFLRITDISAPYTFSWDTGNDGNGNHTIKAIAYDIVNNSATDTITVTVALPAPGSPAITKEPETKTPSPFRFFLIDLPDIVLVGPGAAVKNDFILGFIIATDIALILFFLLLILKRRKKKKEEEDQNPKLPPTNHQPA